MGNIKKMLLGMGIGMAILVSCSQSQDLLTQSGLNPKNFVSDADDKQTGLYVLKNKTGMEVCLTNYGGRIVSIMVPDKNGDMKDVVLGFDNINDYKTFSTDFGASIGRYANRISQGKIVLNGEEIQLPQNNFGHTLHGGPNGWQYKVYDVNQINDTALEFILNSPDGDEGFPGNVKAIVTFKLTDENGIHIKYSATTDKTTVINMTNHSYFNLSGETGEPITDHILYVNANNFTPVDDTFMTTGEIVTVKETPMDFTTPKAVGAEINQYEYAQLKNGNGYDHNWVLNNPGDMNNIAAELVSPMSGIVLDVYTNEPGIQVYSGNFLDGTLTGKGGVVYNQRAAICLETQHYPDSPNKPEWPSVVLEPGQVYQSECIFKFSVEK